jgi:hypothetical protein
MASFNLIVDKSGNIKKRHQLTIVIVVCIIFTLIVTASSNLFYGLIIGGIIFLIQFYKINRAYKYFILEILSDTEGVIVKYMSKNSAFTLNGDVSDFSFKKKIAFNRVKTPYLAVYYKGELKIEQFEEGDWNEQLFDKVISAFAA